MELENLAKRLADPSRPGMSPEIAEKLKLKSEDVVRGQLMAMTDGDRGPLGVYLLAIYVVDDTDLFGDGQIYWWSIPVLLDKPDCRRAWRRTRPARSSGCRTCPCRTHLFLP
jgi:hypothetical protein